MDARLNQTLNLTAGGQGDALAMWKATQARSARNNTRTLEAFRVFKCEHGHMRVPCQYMCVSNGDPEFPLGKRAISIRSGSTYTGTVNEPTTFRT
eukprot:2619661-Prymnesium_polylepis.2